MTGSPVRLSASARSLPPVLWHSEANCVSTTTRQRVRKKKQAKKKYQLVKNKRNRNVFFEPNVDAVISYKSQQNE